MKNLGLILFFTIFIGIYSLVNYYIYSKGTQALAGQQAIKIIFAVIFVFFASSYFLSRLAERFDLYGLHSFLYWCGSFWFAAMEYFLIAALLADLVRLSNVPFGFLPEKSSLLYSQLKLYSFGAAVILVTGLMVYGFINARRPVVKNIEVTLNKKAGNLRELNLVMVSDIHLGVLFGKNRVSGMVQRINSLQPDLVIFAGDILDEVQKPIFKYDTGDPLRFVNAPLGAWGITGNHEYIGDVEKAVKYIESKGIKMLRDSVVMINGSFLLAGREDRDSRNFSGFRRKTVKDLLAGQDMKLPLILLDHQPLHLQQATDAGVDLQLSGHTHHGQFWPNNIFTGWIFEISRGYKKKNNTHFIVSQGYGYWGPPVRIGTRPEIVRVKLKFG